LVHRILSASARAVLTRAYTSLDFPRGAQEASTLARSALRAAGKRLRRCCDLVGSCSPVDRSGSRGSDRGLVCRVGLSDAAVSG